MSALLAGAILGACLVLAAFCAGVGFALLMLPVRPGLPDVQRLQPPLV